jgi:hypothetical protein
MFLQDFLMPLSTIFLSFMFVLFDLLFLMNASYLYLINLVETACTLVKAVSKSSQLVITL